MPSIHIQRRAHQDLKHIWLYSFANWGYRQADIYYDELILGMNVIADNPKIGVAREDLRQGYRSYHINHHVVFYRLTSSKVHIIRVLGEKMDVQRHISKQP